MANALDLQSGGLGSSPTCSTYVEMAEWSKVALCKSVVRGFESHSLLYFFKLTDRKSNSNLILLNQQVKGSNPFSIIIRVSQKV